MLQGFSIVSIATIISAATTVIAATPQVQQGPYSFDGSTLTGSVNLLNIAYQKVLKVIYSDGNDNWQNAQTCLGSYNHGPDRTTNIEVWTYKCPVGAGGISQFYLEYDVNNQKFYDNNGGIGVNYKVTKPATSSSITSTTTTSSTTTSSSSVSSPTSVVTTSTTTSSASTTSIRPPPTNSACSGSGIQRAQFSLGSQYLVVEVLSDTIFHFETSALRSPPANNVIFNSPMVDTEKFGSNFCGSGSLIVSNGGNQFDTSAVTVTVNPSTLAVTVFDKIAQKTLTTFSYGSLSSGQVNSMQNAPSPQLFWTREAAQAVFGLAQTPGLDSNTTNGQQPNSEGNWLNKRLSSPNGYGNVMFGVNAGAMVYTQFPVVYSVAPGGYNHAFFLDVPETLSWDLTSTNHKVQATGARSLRWFTIAGPSLLNLRQQYMSIVGRPALTPKAWLGFSQAKFGFKSFQEAIGELNGLVRANIPVDNMVFDLYWYGEVLGSGASSKFGSLAWDNANFPNVQQNVAAIRALGPGITMIEEPYLGGNGPTAAFMIKNDAVVKQNGAPWFMNSNPWWGTGYQIDHSNPSAHLWNDCKQCALITGCVVDANLCGNTLETTTALSDIVGHWQDLGEPEAFNDKGEYHGTVEDDGVAMNSFRSVLNIYQLLLSQRTAEMYKKNNLPRRVHTLTRTGAPGIQRHGSGLWSGDISSDLNSLARHIGSKKHLSMAGIDYHNSDVGGFHRGGCGGGCDINHLYTTWIANSAWFDFPIKPHVDGHQDSSVTASAAVMGDTASNRFNIQMRYSLIPMLYSLAKDASTIGTPLLTPLFVAYQEHPELYNFGNQYLIGPIMASYTADNVFNGPQGRGVWLANGDWYHFHTHQHYVGSNTYTDNIPYRPFGPSSSIITMPALVKAGSIFPMAWVDSNTKNSRCWDRFNNAPSACAHYFRVYPGQTSTFNYYDDDGETTDYASGLSITVPLRQSLVGNTVTIDIGAAAGNQWPNMAVQRQLFVEVVIPAPFTRVSSVSIDGATISAATSNPSPVNGVLGYSVSGTFNNFVSIAGSTATVFNARQVVVTFA